MSGLRGGGPAGRGRGQNRGGGNNATRGGNNAPLAAQLRQLDRLQEPEEMSVFRRFRDLDVIQVQSTYGSMGLLDRKVLLSPGTLQKGGRTVDEPQWLSVLDADNLLAHIRAQAERERALSRRETRLPEARRRASWGSLTPEEKRILLLSQKEYNSFRAQQGTQTPSAGQARQATSPGGNGAGSSRSAAPAGPSVQPAAAPKGAAAASPPQK
jgi:hypothetical protein